MDKYTYFVAYSFTHRPGVGVAEVVRDPGFDNHFVVRALEIQSDQHLKIIEDMLEEATLRNGVKIISFQLVKHTRNDPPHM